LDTSAISSHSKSSKASDQPQTKKPAKSAQPAGKDKLDFIDLSDVIDIALQLRKRNKMEPISEAETRKQKITVPKPLKHKITGSENIDLLPN